MRTGWAQRPIRFMMLQEVRKIWRAISVQSFEGHGGKFEPYTPFDSDDRKPVELFERLIWRQWRCMRMLVQDNPSHCMLDTLKTSCVLKRSSIKNRVQLIKARRNKCWFDGGSPTCVLKVFFPVGIWTTSNTWYLVPTWVSPPNSKSIGSAVLHSLPVCPTHAQTYRPRYVRHLSQWIRRGLDPHRIEGTCAGALWRTFAYVHCAHRGPKCLQSARSGRMHSPSQGVTRRHAASC